MAGGVRPRLERRDYSQTWTVRRTLAPKRARTIWRRTWQLVPATPVGSDSLRRARAAARTGTPWKSPPDIGPPIGRGLNRASAGRAVRASVPPMTSAAAGAARIEQKQPV